LYRDLAIELLNLGENDETDEAEANLAQNLFDPMATNPRRGFCNLDDSIVTVGFAVNERFVLNSRRQFFFE
jgi:hypothetical protein